MMEMQFVSLVIGALFLVMLMMIFVAIALIMFNLVSSSIHGRRQLSTRVNRRIYSDVNKKGRFSNV